MNTVHCIKFNKQGSLLNKGIPEMAPVDVPVGTVSAKTDSKTVVTESQTVDVTTNTRSTHLNLKIEETKTDSEIKPLMEMKHMKSALLNVTENAEENKQVKIKVTENTELVSLQQAENIEESNDIRQIEEAAINLEHPYIKQPIVKLDRLSEEDQLLMQKSIQEFIETKPKLAKTLGIVSDNSKKVEDEEELESDEEDASTKKRRDKRKHTESDDEYQPDTFSALVSSNKRRKLREEKPEPVVVKPKLRRVEKKFVPVLEKLSQEELMETNTYHRFNKSIELVLKSAEDIDISEIGKSKITMCTVIIIFFILYRYSYELLFSSFPEI